MVLSQITVIIISSNRIISKVIWPKAKGVPVEEVHLTEEEQVATVVAMAIMTRQIEVEEAIEDAVVAATNNHTTNNPTTKTLKATKNQLPIMEELLTKNLSLTSNIRKPQISKISNRPKTKHKN
jgi:hypothetical protein